MAQPQNLPREFGPRQVLLRFCIRTIILATFAAFGRIGLGNSLAALLAMSSVLCAVVATVRRETAFPRNLNHWDESMAYAALHFAGVGLGLAAPL